MWFQGLLYKLYLILLILLIGKELRSQFVQFTPDNGLPATELFDLAYDYKGQLWLASENGLIGYDGNRFHLYTSQDGLNDPTLFKLAIHPTGRIYAAGFHSQIYMGLDEDALTIQLVEQELTAKLSPHFPVSMRFNSQGELLIGSNRKAVVSTSGYDPLASLLPGSGVWIYDRDNVLLAGSWHNSSDRSILHLTIDDGEIHELSLPDCLLPENRFGVIRIPGHGYLLHMAQEIILIDPQFQIRRVKLPMESTCAFWDDHNERLWLGTVKGLFRLQYHELLELNVEEITPTLDETFAISAIQPGSHEDMWISTINQGLIYFPNLQIEILKKNENMARDLAAHGLFASRELIKTLPEWDIPMDVDDWTSGANPNEAYYLKDDILWRFDGEKSNAILNNEGAPIRGFLRFFPGKHGKIWLSGRHGLGVINTFTGEFETYASEVLPYRVSCILETEHSELWVGTSKGLYQRSKDLKWNHIEELAGTKVTGRVSTILEMKNGDLLIGCSGQGIILYSTSREQALLIDEAAGLPGSLLYDLKIGPDNLIYAAGIAGIARLKIEEGAVKRIEVMDNRDGLACNEVSNLLFHRSALYALGPCAVSVISNWPEYTGKADMSIQHNGKWEPKFNRITIAPPDRFLELLIEVKAMPHNRWITPVYRVLEDDTTWTAFESKQIRLDNLSYGSSQLELALRSSDGRLMAHRSFEISLVPPVWKSTWFLILSGIAVIITVAMLVRWYVQRQRRTDQLARKMTELERSALLAQMNPHFVFNALNSIQHYIAANENEKANRFLAKFSRLIRAMLLHSQAPFISLNDEIAALKLYLELEKMRFKEKFNFSIELDEHIDPYAVEIPPLLVQPYLENAIVHGLAKKEGTGEVKLQYRQEGDYLHVSVIDNGIGIETSNRQKQDGLHKSVGMTVTQKRLALLDGNNPHNVKAVETRNEQNEVTGTRVDVRIKIR